MTFSLRTKTSLFIALVLGVAGIVSTSVFIAKQTRDAERTLIERGESFVYAIASAAEAGIMAENLDLLDKSAHVVKEEGVELIQVYATTWDAVDADPLEKLHDRPLPEAQEHFKVSNAIFSRRVAERYDFYSAIFHKASADGPALMVGYARIVLSADRMRTETRKTVVFGIVTSAFISALSIIVVNVVVRRLVVGPLEKLTHSMSLFKNGQPVGDLTVVADDEVGQLSAAFNTMRRTLQENDSILKESATHTSLILNSIAEGICGADVRGNCTFCNPAALRMLGYESEEDVVGKKIHLLIHHTHADGTPYHAQDCRIYQTCRDGKGVHLDNEVFWRADGSSFPVDYWAQPIMRDGVPIGAVTAFTDITARRREARLLAENEARLRTLVHTIPDLIWLKDRDGVYLFCNPIFERLYGASEAEIIGKTDYDFVDRELADFFREHDLQAIAAGKPSSNEEWLTFAADGYRGLFDTIKTPMRDSEGALIGVLGIARDITAHKRAQEALRDREQELSAIFDNAPFLMILIDGERRFVRGTQAALFSHAGAFAADVIDTRFGEAIRCINALKESGGCGFGSRCKECVVRNSILDTLETGRKHYQREVLLQVSAGCDAKEVALLISTARLTIRKQPMVLVSLNDVTENKRIETQLRQSQKMESIGTLAGGVAHDFNNILTVIIGYSSIVLANMPKDDSQRHNVEQVLEAADRAAHLTKDLLLFSRKQPVDKKAVELNECVQKSGTFLKRIMGEDISFKTSLSAGAIRIFADLHQIDQVLMNLATNARDAMPTGGVFSITTEEVWLNEESSVSRWLELPGSYALLTISDTGGGMDEETCQRIFEPFFTTKELGKGTGLGLSVVYSIVKQHEGYVTVYSEPGQGTSFRIYLPIFASGVVKETESVVEELPVGGTETILLAEDDKAVLGMTHQMLQNSGYTVIPAVDGADAVQKFVENKERIQLLLLDLVMPKKNGKAAYDEIKNLRPDIKVIFTSGYDPDMVRQKTLLEQNAPVISKPMSASVLRKIVRNVLDHGVA